MLHQTYTSKLLSKEVQNHNPKNYSLFTSRHRWKIISSSHSTLWPKGRVYPERKGSNKLRSGCRAVLVGSSGAVKAARARRRKQVDFGWFLLISLSIYICVHNFSLRSPLCRQLRAAAKLKTQMLSRLFILPVSLPVCPNLVSKGCRHRKIKNAKNLVSLCCLTYP